MEKENTKKVIDINTTKEELIERLNDDLKAWCEAGEPVPFVGENFNCCHEEDGKYFFTALYEVDGIMCGYSYWVMKTEEGYSVMSTCDSETCEEQPVVDYKNMVLEDLWNDLHFWGEEGYKPDYKGAFFEVTKVDGNVYIFENWHRDKNGVVNGSKFEITKNGDDITAKEIL